MKTVSQLDPEGYFVGPALADESPLEPGVYLLPGGCVDLAPIKVPAGKRARISSEGFGLEDTPPLLPAAAAPIAPPAIPPTPLQQIRALEKVQAVRDAMERANRLASFVVAKTELVRQQAAKVPSVTITHEQAHAFLYGNDKPYKLLWDLEQTVAPIRKLIV